VTLRAEAGFAVLSDRDRGPGLDPAFRDKAFDRFTRAPRTAAVPGHGLGLSLVRAIAVRHGARVDLADAAPGLSVAVRLPRGEA
jgi:signal transduction histidine kinase